MDDTQKLDVERMNGQYAQDLLNNPIFQDIWTKLEAQLIAALKGLNPRDADGREKGVQALILLDQLKLHVTDAAATGKMARFQLERKTFMQEARAWMSRDGLTV